MSSGVAILLEAHDEVGHGQEESLAVAFRGVSEDDARWQPPAYSDADSFAGMPPAGTIQWHVAYLVHCARHYVEILRSRPVGAEPMTAPPVWSGFEDLRRQLQDARSRFREEIARLEESDLASPCVRGMTVQRFVLMAARHEAWHAGQIMLVRRLLRVHRELSRT